MTCFSSLSDSHESVGCDPRQKCKNLVVTITVKGDNPMYIISHISKLPVKFSMKAHCGREEPKKIRALLKHWHFYISG